MRYITLCSNDMETHKIFPVTVGYKEIKLVVKDNIICISVCSLCLLLNKIENMYSFLDEVKKYEDLIIKLKPSIVDEIYTTQTFLVLKHINSIYYIKINKIPYFMAKILSSEEVSQLSDAVNGIKKILQFEEEEKFTMAPGMYKVTLNMKINDCTYHNCVAILKYRNNTRTYWHILGCKYWYKEMEVINPSEILKITNYKEL